MIHAHGSISPELLGWLQFGNVCGVSGKVWRIAIILSEGDVEP